MLEMNKLNEYWHIFQGFTIHVNYIIANEAVQAKVCELNNVENFKPS